MTTARCIGLLDDDLAFVRTLRGQLSSAGYTVHTWTSARDFFQSSSRSKPACMVIELSMHGMDGLEFQQRLAEEDPAMPVLFLTGHGSIPAAVRAMKQGAANFLTKPATEAELFDSIKSAISTGDRERSRHAKAAFARSGFDKLTHREREVMTHLITGKLNKQIAADLGTCEQTIKVHRMRIHHKMGIRSLAELVHLAALLPIHPVEAP